LLKLRQATKNIQRQNRGCRYFMGAHQLPDVDVDRNACDHNGLYLVVEVYSEYTGAPIAVSQQGIRKPERGPSSSTAGL
jgi:hypothetical protein